MGKLRKRLELDIMGCKWGFEVLPNSSYTKKFGSDSRAITFYNEKMVYINKNDLYFETIIHELTHVFLDCSLTDSASLDGEQVEEVLAEIFATHYHEFSAIAVRILNFFRGA